MTARTIEGKARAEALRAQVAERVRGLAARGRAPGLAVVLVGEDPGSQIYVRSKGEQSEAIGMRSMIHRLPSETSQAALLALVDALNADEAVDGVLIQLPLPRHLDSAEILARLDPDKDVDGLTVANAGRLASGLPGLRPCTPLGCLILLRETLGSLAGARAVVLGRSALVGRPVAQLLLLEDCTVTIGHSKSHDLPALAREADILVAAVGRPHLVGGDWIKPGATVIDVGINRTPHPDPAKAARGKTRVTGDVDFAAASEVAGWITPVPGGVGPMTVACLLHNTVLAAERRLERG
jgi:methylenetetrahydrofolate dehydrogenase (NADP+)/methenyltetrahydrofolate cyclohydrolase